MRTESWAAPDALGNAAARPPIPRGSSRYVVAWTVAAGNLRVAETMLEEEMGVHGFPGALHADRGTSMTSKPVAQLLVDLHATR